MKTIKLDFCGFWSDFDKENNRFVDILRKWFEVKICSEPDFVIASVLGEPFEYLKYNCVRILYTGEPLSPDFNLFDYAISFENIKFDDRHYRYPYPLYNHQRADALNETLTLEKAKQILNEKKYFCNFIYSHPSANGDREALLAEIASYKDVECVGSYKNNRNYTVKFGQEKIDFVKKCKFTIACESVSFPGFVTEKLRDAFAGFSIPIYLGDPNVENEYAPNAFINCNQSRYNFGEILERIREIDQNDELYLEMLMAQKYADKDYLKKMDTGFEIFLYKIFSQNPNEAYRRLRLYRSKMHEDFINDYRELQNNKKFKIFRKISKGI